MLNLHKRRNEKMYLHNFAEYQRALSTAKAHISASGTTINNALTTLKNLTDSNTSKYLVGLNSTSSFASLIDWAKMVNAAFCMYDSISARVGAGTTAVDEEDYCLDDDVTSSFSSITFSKNIGVSEEGHLILLVTWSGTNATANDITISEFGIVKDLYMFTNSTITTTNYSGAALEHFLIARMILTNPVTISAGNTGTITVKVEMF
jgi:hypothetical protein